MKRLYKILGVEYNSSKSDIKKAYRKKAKETHPDKPNGDKAKFEDVAKAYKILSDDHSREHYDNTGDEEPNVKQRRDQEFENSIFEKLVSLFCESDCSTRNIIKKMSDDIKAQSKAIEAENRDIQSKIKNLTSNLKRLKVKDKVTFPTLYEKLQMVEIQLNSKQQFNEKKIEILLDFSEKLKKGVQFIFEKQEQTPNSYADKHQEILNDFLSNAFGHKPPPKW